VAWGFKGTGAVLTVDTTVITNNRHISIQREQRSTWVLTITNITMRDRGGYWCQINTIPIRSSMGYLNVVEPPVVEGGDEEVNVNSGDTANLTCRAHGTPHPAIRWIREDYTPIRLTDTILEREVVGSHLTLRDVDYTSAGGYLCIASNGHPPSDSKRIKVKVNFAPEVESSRGTVWAVPGSTVSLTCLYAAHPNPRVDWQKDTSLGPHPVKREYFTITPQDGHPPYTHNTTLHMRNLVFSDFGIYTCSVSNVMGEAQATIILREVLTTTTTTTTTTTMTTRAPTTAHLPPPRQLYGDYDDSAKNLTAPLVFNTFPELAKGVRQDSSSGKAASSSSNHSLHHHLHHLLLLLLVVAPALTRSHSHPYIILIFAVAWQMCVAAS
ncbi:hypothetical protein Pmani_019403, partial [Petrolisthes manimaculis]